LAVILPEAWLCTFSLPSAMLRCRTLSPAFGSADAASCPASPGDFHVATCGRLASPFVLDVVAEKP